MLKKSHEATVLRRRQGLAALRQALATPTLYPNPALAPTELRTWLTRLEADTAAVKRPGHLARAHLVLRERLLREEADELEKLLAAETGAAT